MPAPGRASAWGSTTRTAGIGTNPMPWAWITRGIFPTAARRTAQIFRGKSLPQVRELLTQYRPSVIWFDVPSDLSTEQSQQFLAMIRRLQPACIVNDRVGNGLGDDGTPEQYIPPTRSQDDFEVCMTLNDHWGFDRNDHNWKPPPGEVIRNLVDVVSKGGNYLLNVGPRRRRLSARMPYAFSARSARG